MLGRLALEVANDAPGHVLDVERAFAQIGIIDLAQRFGVTRRHFLENPFHVAKIGFQFAQDFIDQGAIFDHEQMRIENPGVLRPDRFGDLLLHFENLHARLDQRRSRSGRFRPGSAMARCGNARRRRGRRARHECCRGRCREKRRRREIGFPVRVVAHSIARV